MTAFLLVVAALLSYIFGLIPWPIIVSRYFFHKDCRAHHGRSNPTYGEFRQRFGVKGMVILMALDIVSGLLACLISGALLSFRDLLIVGRIFGIFCYLMGCCFPFLWLFRGRRGTLPALVMLFLVDWRVALCCLVLYIVALVFLRYEVIAACAAAVLSALFMWLFGGTGLQGLLLFLCAVLVVVCYRDSLGRLIHGGEPQLSSVFPRRRRDEDADEDDEI